MGDLISRQTAIDALINDPIGKMIAEKYNLVGWLEGLPSAQPEPISKAYAKAVFAWLLDYQIKAAEMEGRYIPYEVLSWVANDWRKENE